MGLELKLDARRRDETGRAAMRRLRREKRLPAIIYGAEKDAQPITLDGEQVYRLMEEEAFFSQIIELKVEGKKEEVILKDLQRHPYKPLVNHLDFQRVQAHVKLTTKVPLHLAGAEEAVGVKQGGGIVHQDITDVEITCLPRHLPEYLELDISGLDIGDSRHLSEIPLPEGVEIPALAHGADYDASVVSIHVPRAAMVEEEEEAEAEAAEEAEEGAEEAAEGERAESGEEAGGEDEEEPRGKSGEES